MFRLIENNSADCLKNEILPHEFAVTGPIKSFVGLIGHPNAIWTHQKLVLNVCFT